MNSKTSLLIIMSIERQEMLHEKKKFFCNIILLLSGTFVNRILLQFNSHKTAEIAARLLVGGSDKEDGFPRA